MNAANETRKKWFQEGRWCMICRRNFTHKDCLGKFECREHPGIIKSGEWTCCGMRVSREITTISQYYDRPFSLNLLGCVPCDHKETLTPYSTMKMADYRELGASLGGSTIQISRDLYNRRIVNPNDEAIGHSDQQFMEIYRFSKKMYERILSCK